MKSAGLSKKERLSGKGSFDELFKKGKVRKNTWLVVRSFPNQLSFSRLGVAVSKKKVRKANQRNRFKRLIREAYRLNKKQLPKGLDIIVNLKKTDGLTLTVISESLKKLLYVK
ncbi:MAG: ribonuclease P protein component [Planctomycetes bacterium]|nr:ribonuclease P protein component [Planctomycetota bacterium]